MGYGILDVDDSQEVKAVDYGVLEASSKSERGDRLLTLHTLLGELLDKWKPVEISVEEPFVGRNVRSAFAIGEARGVALIVAAARDIPVHQYAPTKVKLAVTGYGRAEKDQVRKMVTLELNLQESPTSTDASDALAVALCHLAQTRLQRAISRGQ